MLPALRRLSVNFAPGMDVSALQWLMEFITSLSADGLEDLAISAQGDLQTYQDTIWGRLHTLLTHEPTFHCLCHVEVDVNFFPHTYYQVEEWEAVRLVRCQLLSDSRVTFELTAPIIQFQAELDAQLQEDLEREHPGSVFLGSRVIPY